MPYDNEYERLLTWFGKSPTWLQEAAKKLLTEHKPFSEKDITRFADTCIKEARKEKYPLPQSLLKTYPLGQPSKAFRLPP